MSDIDAILQLREVRAALSELDDTGAAIRTHARDATVFDGDTAANRLGWLDATTDAQARAELLDGFADAVRADGMDRVVLAGMGGSSLAPEVFARTAAATGGPPRSGLGVEVLDSTHPDAVRAVLDRDLSRTLVVVSSKSGSTEETRCFAAFAAARVPDPAHLVAVTDPDSALDAQATREGWRHVFRNPADVGGRYSALTWFGLVPAALAGVDVREVLARADDELDRIGPSADYKNDPGRMADVQPGKNLAAYLGGMGRSGRDKLTILAAPGLESFGDWAEQLVAESLGKSGRGVVPVVGEPVGAPGVYGEDRAFVELRLRGARADGVEELEAAGLPVLSLDLADAADLGAQFMRWELAVALCGPLLGVDPFDEPNVAESKANTTTVVEDVIAGAALPDPEDGDLEALFASVDPGDYVSIQAYLAPTPELRRRLSALQGSVRDALGVAVTAGVGPRFLHSTGQLHKGGPASVVALQVVDARLWEPSADGLAIPGRHHDFSQFIRAQAVGDLRALRDHQRRVAQVAVDADTGLDGLTARVEATLPAASSR